MKFIKLIKANNSYTYISNNAEKELNNRELALRNYKNDKNKRNLNYGNDELVKSVQDAENSLASLKIYLDYKNNILDNLDIETLTIIIFNNLLNNEIAKKYIVDEKIETSQEIKDQIKSALQKIIK